MWAGFRWDHRFIGILSFKPGFGVGLPGSDPEYPQTTAIATFDGNYARAIHWFRIEL